MAGSKQYYVLTQTAEHDFRQARIWSRKRWGAELTRAYFQDLHEGAQYVAQNWRALPSKTYITGETELGIYAVREHYVVFVPVPAKDMVIIVALIRQTRDVPAILKSNSFSIKRALQRINANLM
jgi:plasmid stabilization system protein ParE